MRATFVYIQMLFACGAVHTAEEQDGEETFRIISARKASRSERGLYEAPE